MELRTADSLLRCHVADQLDCQLNSLYHHILRGETLAEQGLQVTLFNAETQAWLHCHALTLGFLLRNLLTSAAQNF